MIFLSDTLFTTLSDPGDKIYNSEQFPSPSNPRLVRSLGLIDIIMIGIAGMIGGSIFVLTGPAIGLAGSAVIIAFIINAIITLFTAMAYAELGSAMPEAGGGYLWIKKGLPRPNAFISGWLAWFAHIVAGSLYALGFGSFLSSLLQMTNIFTTSEFFDFLSLDKLIAIISIIIFTYINIKGVSETGKTGTLVTILQLGTIVVIIIVGLSILFGNPEWDTNFSDFMPMGLTGLVAAMGLTFIAFEGYEIIVQTGEEVKNPRKNIPRAIFISLAIVVIMYCLVAFVAIGASSSPDNSPTWKFIGNNGELGIMKAVDSFLPYGTLIVLGGGIISTLAALNATTFSSARVAFAMGRYYNLPQKLSKIHSKNKTPHIATVLSGIIMIVMAYALPLDQIALAAGVIFLLLFTQVNIAVITIRRIYGDKLQYGFKIPLFPIIPIIGIFLKLGLALYLLITQPLSWGITALWVIIGFSLYRMYTFKKEIDHYAPIVTSEGNLSRSDFRILLPYTPDNPDRLIHYAIYLANQNDGEINVLRTITVPNQTPLSAGIAFADGARKSFEPLEKVLEEENIMNHYLVRISHDSTEAILATIEEQKIKLLISDYETLRSSKKLQTLITCDILAIKTTGNDHLLFQYNNKTNSLTSEVDSKKNLVVIYDEHHDSDLVLKTVMWLSKSDIFNVRILFLKQKKNNVNSISEIEINNPNNTKSKHLEYLEEIKFDVNDIYLSPRIYNNSERLSDIILSAINISQPDLIITSATIGKYNFYTNSDLISLLHQTNCPVIISDDFTIPVVHSAKHWLSKFFNR
ncbi:MAG: amino acid permease [Nitrososphaeraceae archaeon]